MMAQAWGGRSQENSSRISENLKESGILSAMFRSSFWLYYARGLGNRQEMLPENTKQALELDEMIPAP